MQLWCLLCVLADPVFKRRTKKRLETLTSLSPMTKRRKLRLLASLTCPFENDSTSNDFTLCVAWTCFMLYGLETLISTKAFCRN